MGRVEPYPWVHAAVASLTAGPVAPGDAIGAANRSQIMRTCRADGMLLKPDRPATPPDSYWLRRAFGAVAGRGPKGELLTTETTVSGLRWHFALGMALAEDYHLTLTELRAAGSAWPANYPAHSSGEGGAAEVIGYMAWDVEAGPSSARRLTDAQPLVFPAGRDYGAATLFAVAPVLASGWAILGDAYSFVAVARQRVASVDSAGGEVMVELLGVAGERVEIWAASCDSHAVCGAPRPYPCVMPTVGRVALTLPSGRCASR